MKFKDAMDFIRKHEAGFRVEFEKIEGAILASDHFPDHGEQPIETEESAWLYAEKFAEAGRNKGIVNVYVIHGDTFIPVEGYFKKKLNVYP